MRVARATGVIGQSPPRYAPTWHRSSVRWEVSAVSGAYRSERPTAGHLGDRPEFRARARTLVRARPGAVLELIVEHRGRRKHLPVVSLQQVNLRFPGQY